MKKSKKILPSVSSLSGKTNLFPLSPPFGEAYHFQVTQFGLSRKLQLGLREVWHPTSWWVTEDRQASTTVMTEANTGKRELYTTLRCPRSTLKNTQQHPTGIGQWLPAAQAKRPFLQTTPEINFEQRCAVRKFYSTWKGNKKKEKEKKTRQQKAQWPAQPVQ